jgi:hypothetical protein
VDEKSYEYIVKNSWWGLRNAISLFEQLITDEKIEYTNILENLWVPEEEFHSIFLKKLLTKDTSLVEDFEKIIEEGKNVKVFFKEFLFFTKKEALNCLKEWKEIQDIVNILEVLDDTYAKTKTSLDENTTFLIGILKILSGGEKKENKNDTIDTTPTRQTNTIQKEKVVVKEPEIEISDNIDVNDIDDIFSSEIGEKKEKETKQESWNSFNIEALIQELKKLWAKWSLTIGIRWADVKRNGENLEIKFKTQFALKSADTSDNKSLIYESLKNLWLDNLTVKLL